MKLASFDLEVCDELQSPDAHFTPRISCAALALQDSPESEPTVQLFQSPEGQEAMTGEQVTDMAMEMLELASLGYNMLTWNGVAFDYQVVHHFAWQNCQPDIYRMAWQNHIDMMLLVSFQTGYRLGLDAALLGAGLQSKLHNVTLSTGEALTDMSGAKAPELWQRGERKAVLDYLTVDVIQPLKLARSIEARKRITWTSKKGRPMSINTDLLTVEQAYKQLPEPADLSWLTDPISRRSYINKYLPGVLSHENFVAPEF